MHLWWGGGVEEQMHNVDYDPGPWRQTLRLPPPGIEPGLHASQVGTRVQRFLQLGYANPVMVA
jgi:hypothetical protein